MQFKNNKLTNTELLLIKRAAEREVSTCCFDVNGKEIDLDDAASKEQLSFFSSHNIDDYLKEQVANGKEEQTTCYLKLNTDLNLIDHYLIADNVIIDTNGNQLTVDGIIANNLFLVNDNDNVDSYVMAGAIAVNAAMYVDQIRLLCNLLLTNDLSVAYSTINAQYWDRNFIRFSYDNTSIKVEDDGLGEKYKVRNSSNCTIEALSLDALDELLDGYNASACMFEASAVKKVYDHFKQRKLWPKKKTSEAQAYQDLMCAVAKLDYAIKNQGNISKFVLHCGVMQLFSNPLTKDLCSEFLECYGYKDAAEVASSYNHKQLKELIMTLVIDFVIEEEINAAK